MPLIGRRAERERIAALFGPDPHGPRHLLVTGEAGIGKTALLAAAAAQVRESAAGCLTAQASPSESRYPFAGLHQLLLPLLDGLHALPQHLRACLAEAFGAVAAPPPEPRHVAVAVLALLNSAARRRGLRLIVDDAHHADRETQEVLGFVARRLRGDRVALLMAAGGPRPPGPFAQLSTLPLGPLDDCAAARLLDAQRHAPTGRARLELLRYARGNPLAVVELCQAHDPASPEHPCGTARLSGLFADRLRALPAATRRLLLYAAAATEHEDLTTIMTAAGHGSDLSGWRPAEDAGLVTVFQGHVHFRHPLLRPAAYRTAPAQLRQQAHRDLAGALAAVPERRAWHTARAVVGRDEDAAADLEDTAGRAVRTDGWFAAARALELAAEHSPAADDRARRYVKALCAASLAGSPAWVDDLHRTITPLTGDPGLLGRAACGAALSLSASGRPREAFRLLATGIGHGPPPDGGTLLAMAGTAAAVAVQSGLPEIRRTLLSLLHHVRDAPSGTSSGRPLPAALPGDVGDAVSDAILAVADPAANAPLLLESGPQPYPGAAASEPADTIRQLATGVIAWHADDPETCVDALRRAAAVLRARGASAALAPCLTTMATALIDTGRWDEADEVLSEARRLAAVLQLKVVGVDAEALRVLLGALRGDAAPGLEAATWTAVDLEENRTTHVHLRRAAAARAEAAGDLDEAFRHLRALYGEDAVPVHHLLSGRAVVDLAATARRTGRRQEIAPLLASARAQAGPRPTTRMTLLLHHAAALLDDSSAAEQHYRLAVINPAAQQWPLERARARMHYGQWLRRNRRSLEARPLLAAALETFTQLGARGPADQAAAELRASGVSSGPAGPDPLAALTAQQQQIVRMAASGLGNREIAERLMLSPRTIGSHLYQAYPKLGVSNRRQLRDIVDDA